MKRQYLLTTLIIMSTALVCGSFTPLMIASDRKIDSVECPVCMNPYEADSIVIQYDCGQSCNHHFCLDCASTKVQDKPCPICNNAQFKIHDPRINAGNGDLIHHRYKCLTPSEKRSLTDYTKKNARRISQKPYPDTVLRQCLACNKHIDKEQVVVELACGHSLCLADAVQVIGENKAGCPLCKKGPMTVFDPLEKNEHDRIVLKYLQRAPTKEESAALDKVRSNAHINVFQDHIPEPLRVPLKPVASKKATVIDQLVDVTSPAYEEHRIFLDEIAIISRDIKKAERGRRAVEKLVAQKSEIEEQYVDMLKNRSQLYYTADDLWYYHMARNTHDLALMSKHPIHGPVFNQLNTKRPHSDIGLTSPLIYLVSFKQIENICGFAAIANAAAIEQQIAELKPITFADTRCRAEANIEKTKVLMESVPAGIGYASAGDLMVAADALELKPGTLEILDKSTVSNLHARLLKGENVDRTLKIKQKLAQNKTTHVIYNVGGSHWVLVSLVQENDGITMYLLDSSNGPLKQGNDVILLLRYFDHMIEQVYLAKAYVARSQDAFEKALNKVPKLQAKLLEMLVKIFVVEADAQKKELLSTKIDLCAQKISATSKSGKIPQEVRDFATLHTGNAAHVWPQNFKMLADLPKVPQPTNQNQSKNLKKSTTELSSSHFLGGLLAGVVMYALYHYWLHRSPQKKETNAKLVGRNY